MRRGVFGRSAQRRALRLVEFGRLRRPTLILGGFHGDEPKSVHVVRLFVDELVLRQAYFAGWHGLVLQAVETHDDHFQAPTAWSTRPCHPS